MSRYLKYIIVFLLSISFSKIDASNLENDIKHDSITIRYGNLNTTSLSFNAYKKAIKGYYYYKNKGVIEGNIIAIIDYNLPSTEERLFIIDVTKDSLLYTSLVAHGRNSGNNMAVKFSNNDGSHKSSLGFFSTEETYIGKHGASLRLNGLEKGINNNARSRNIVIHKAKYVSKDFIQKHNRIGRSHGCPALPELNYNKIFDYLDDKILLYIYSSKPSLR